MLKHTQTLFGNGDDGSRPGNCFQTAIASLLELSLDEVPHFAELDDWFGETLDWLNGRSKKVSLFRRTWEGQTIDFGSCSISPINYAPSGQLMVAVGMSPRGLMHSVLWKAGEVVHDPHPDRTGLSGPVEEFWSIK